VDAQESFVLEVSSVDEARNIAASKWFLEPEDIVAKVIEEEKTFFGFLGRKLTVEVSPAAPLGLLRGKRTLDGMLSLMDLDVESSELDNEFINISGEDAGIIIGKYGETLKALEFLVNLMVRDMDLVQRVKLDSDGYRSRREASLQRLALAAARKTVRRRRPTYLEPMSSWERRIIHITLKGRSDIETRSVGEEPARKVVVWPSKSAGRVSSNRY